MDFSEASIPAPSVSLRTYLQPDVFGTKRMLVVAIGTDFDGMMTQNWRMPAPSHLIAFNVDAVDASKSYRPDVMIVADAAVAYARSGGPS